ncbi:hypothetical protein [Granulicella sp. S156]|uniref:hypothetical protein n=1 Tax=Granulicella sp. S156 TaxID=1747224 RepID=UPI00131C878E|nr:hypothetical protein [Granulicella sp. S156]
MKRILLRTIVGLLAAVIVAYLVDWVVWKVRMAHGTGMGQVQVVHVLAEQMKGNKEAYYLNDVEMMDCSRSLFPRGGSAACWWVNWHRQVIDH